MIMTQSDIDFKITPGGTPRSTILKDRRGGDSLCVRVWGSDDTPPKVTLCSSARRDGRALTCRDGTKE